MEKNEVVSFKQTVTLNASASEIYDRLMDSKKHAEFTGGKAKIGKKEGDAFSVFDGYSYGKNIKLVKDKLIVQSWRAVEDEWPEEWMSEITFKLIPLGKNKTKIEFLHKKVPATVADNFKKGWIDYYWTPLKQLYNHE